MNDLFEQFSSQFEKPKEAPVASEPIAARNFKDNIIPVTETYAHMEFITGHKHFCDAYGYIIPKVYRDTYWEPNQVKKEVNYTHMPEGMKEAQTNNGVYDHVNGFPFAPVAITHTQPIAPDQQLPEIVATETEFEIEGETDDKGQASLFEFGEYEPSSKENLFVSGKKTDSFGSPLEESLKKINRDKMSSMEFEREYMQSPTPQLNSDLDLYFSSGGYEMQKEIAIENSEKMVEYQKEKGEDTSEMESLIEKVKTPMLSKALQQSDVVTTVFLDGQIYELDENKRAIGYVPAFEGMQSDKQNVWIGIDPGKKGGITCIGFNGAIIGKWAIPLIEDNVDSNGIWNIFQSITKNYSPTLILEDVHSLFGMSASTNFSMGHTLGILDGIIAVSKIKLIRIAPKTWQKEIWQNNDMQYEPAKDGGKPKVHTKRTSIAAAHRLFPGVDFRPTTRSKKPSDGICDAACLAEYGRRKNL